MKIDHLRIEKVKYEIYNKDIEYAQFTCGYSKELIDYRFYTNWLALNQKNFEAYKSMTHNDRRSFLQRILIGHILNFYSAVSLKLTDEERLFCKVDVTERMAKLKGNKMISFKGEFSVNAYIPEGIGLGRSVSRGFGTLKKV